MLNLHPSWTYDFNTHDLDTRLQAKEFLNWKKHELRKVKLTYSRRGRRGTKKTHEVAFEICIPAAYKQLVCQLVGEIQNSERHDMYEAHRREVYARRVLDHFGQEIIGLRGCPDTAMIRFRSKVLTPILMRQLWGADDAQAPFAERAIRGAYQTLNIEAVTSFYLGDDPTDPVHIPTYRRNLLYVPMARWYLGHLMDAPDTKEHYDQVLKNHDDIMEMLKEQGHQEMDAKGFPILSEAEESAIIGEGLSGFFKPELARLVRRTCFDYPLPFR